MIALDWGEKRIGWAISDSTATLVSKSGVYKRETKQKDIGHVKRIIQDNHIDELVLGLPRNMDGSLGKQAKNVFRFKEKLEEEVQIPIKLFDERLTTKEAERILLQVDMRREKRKKLIDGISASVILQGYLDKSSK